MKNDTFRPHLPIDDPEQFFGRVDELKAFAESLIQIRNGNPRHIAITGDRGVGKTSFLTQVLKMASGNQVLQNRYNLLVEEKLGFKTSRVDATRKHDIPDVCDAFRYDLESRLKSILSKIQITLDLKLFSVDFSEFKSKHRGIEDQFVALIEDAFNKLYKAEKIDGLLVAIDEIDRIDPNIGLGTFLKLVAEKFARDGYNTISIIICGITGAVQHMKAEHESVGRLFQEIPIEILGEDEVREILANGFKLAPCKFNDDIVSEVHFLSRGFGQIVHLIGSHCLKVDTDDLIDKQDLNEAKKLIVKETLKNELNSKLQYAGYGKYQKILEVMAKYNGKTVPLEYIASENGWEQNQFSTNMGVLVNERHILRKPMPGYYEFVDPLLRTYIETFGVIKLDESHDDEDENEQPHTCN